MSPEDSDYNSLLSKLILRKFQWRSKELTKELRSLDRKAYRSKSERGRRLMVKREIGGFIPDSLHSYPRWSPAWAQA